MRKKDAYLLVLFGVQWFLLVLILFVLIWQFYFGFSFNLSIFLFFLSIILYKFWQMRYDYSARKSLDTLNKEFHALGRRGIRKILYSKGIKKHMK